MMPTDPVDGKGRPRAGLRHFEVGSEGIGFDRASPSRRER